MRAYLKLLILLTWIAVQGNDVRAQELPVEVVIATGMEMSQASAFSPDNRFVAQALYNAITIWDVKSGRMIRVATYVDNISQVIDTIWFSEDSKYVMVGIAVSNDQYKVDIATGKSTYLKGAPYDYSNYQYVQSNRTKSSLYLYSGKKAPVHFKSPNGKAELVYNIITNPYGNTKMMPHMFETHIKVDGKLSPPLDTCFQANFCFSADGQYAFCESSIYDLVNARLVSQLKIVPFSGSSVMFVPGTHIPITAAINSLRIWNFPDIDDVKINHLTKFLPSKDGKSIIAEKFNFETGEREFLKIDLEKRKIIGKSAKTKETGYLLDVSPDGTQFSFLEMIKKDPSKYDITYNVKICEAETGRIIKQIPNSTKAYFTSEPGVLLTDSAGVHNMKTNINSGVSSKFPVEKQEEGSIAYMISRDGKFMLGSTVLNSDERDITSEVFIWEMLTGKVVFSTEVTGINMAGFDMSQDGKYVSFATDAEHAILIYDFATKQRIHKLKAHTAIVTSTIFSDDGKRMISSALDGTRRLWNLESGKEMVSLVNTGPHDFAIITPKQYYYATKDAKRLIHFVKGIEIYPFSQFDLKYNRPDIIIESMEASNQSLAKPFYYAYQKRLKRLGFTEEMLDGGFHMPEVNLTNEREIPLTTTKEKLTIHLAATDDKFKLDRVLVRVNEVPIHGKSGLSLKSKNSNSYSGEIEIELSNGTNMIACSVLNEKGVESLASNIVIEYNPTSVTKPNLYLYTIGVSKYQQSQYDLTYAAKDANDIQSLYGLSPGPFNQVISKELSNEAVTIENIQKIKQELMNTKVDDAVCVFFAGHGILDADLNYYLASYDIDFQNPGARGIPYDVLEDLLDDIPARKKLIMIDACHSGEIDKEEVALFEGENNETANPDISFRSVNSTSLKRVGLNNSFELMKELFNDIRKSSGTVIISSAGGMEYAMEGGEWNNGVFTYCFLNGIKNKEADLNGDGKVMLSEMNEFVHAKVFELTNGQQQPTNRAEVLESDWRLW